MISKSELEQEIETKKRELKEIKYKLGEELWSKDCSYIKTYFPDKYEKIKEIEKILEIQKQKILQIDEGRFCLNCGMELAEESRFCNYCGCAVVCKKLNVKKCKTCGNEIEEDALFCSFCGSKIIDDTNSQYIPRHCSNCNAENDEDAKFCILCGYKII